MAGATKIQGVLLAWTAIPDTVTDTPSVSSGSLDLGEGVVDAVLAISVAHTDANAASTNRVFVKVEILEDTIWRLFAVFSAGGGTAVKEDIAAQSASGQTHIEVADTTDWDTGAGERLFILDATLANSEIVEINGWADNDYYIANANLLNTHENTADLLDGLTETNVSIPNGIRYVRVSFHNADDDANYAGHVAYSAVSAYV